MPAGGYGSTTQMPGRIVASKPPPTAAAPPAPDEVKAKSRSPFGTTSTKKRKPSPSGRQSGALTVGAAAGAAVGAAAVGVGSAVKTRPSSKRSPAGALSAQGTRQEGPDARRDAQLVLSRVEPWSVMKFTFIVSLVGWIVLFVAIALLYYALRAFGLFHYLEQTVVTVTSSKGHPGSNAVSWFSASTVLGYTMLVGAINVVLFTALATVGAVVYNLVTHLSGGVEVTLREAD
jgi:hypothetical protein